MPSGVFKMTEIPEDKVETVMADYQLDNLFKVNSGA